MNVLDRIVELRLERGWTEYQLSQQSGITQSTISAWYRKNTLPSIPSLQKICRTRNFYFRRRINSNKRLFSNNFQFFRSNIYVPQLLCTVERHFPD